MNDFDDSESAALPSALPAAGEGSLLDRPAGEAARRLALRQIDRVREARRALAAGADPEALHDLRVGLRRLRSLLRAFAGELRRAVGRKLRRQLGNLAAATNPGRDAEVGLERVERWLADLPASPERRTTAALAARLAKARDHGYGRLDADFLERLDRRLDRLAERLAVWEIALRPAGDPAPSASFRSRLGAELARHHERLERALADAAEGDAEASHRARIEAKRLRYLLEPVADELPSVAAALRPLRKLQDRLGAANDLAVLADTLATIAVEREAERLRFAAGVAPRPVSAAGGRRGRIALARRIHDERDTLHEEFVARWLAPRAAERSALERELEAVERELASQD